LAAPIGVGTRIGDYRIEELLGRGGMSVVYRAEDLRLGRRVALKLLAAELAEDPRFRARFLAESRLAASIDHPGIVPIFEADEADGLLYIAMRYVEGTDLRQLLRDDGPLDATRAVGLVSQLAAALDAAHARGLVHRDVKPSNALVAVEGAREHVYLADFGLTKHSGSGSGPTAAGEMVGTIDYVAPEQIRGEQVDGRADVYSLGCVLFECLTGTVPFPRGSEVATMYAHLQETPPLASDRRPELPPALDAAVDRALAKEPEDRWQTAGELAAAAQVVPVSGRAARMRGRRPPRRALVALAAVVAVAAAAAALVIGSGDDDATLAAIDANAVAVIDPGHASLTAQIPVGAAQSQMAAGAGGVWVTDADAGTVSRLDPRTHTVRQTIEVGESPSAIAVGSGGVWVANSLSGTVTWIAPATNRPVKTIGVGNRPTGVCVVGGSVWAASGDDATVTRIDARTGDKVGTTRLDAGPSALACGGGRVWAGSDTGGTVTELDAADGKPVATIPSGPVSAAAFSDGALWVTNTAGGTVSRIDPRRGIVAGTVAFGAGDGPVALAAAPGSVWVSNEFAGTVARIDARSGRVVRTLRLRNRPQGIAVVDGALWVGTAAAPARHVGGTLRVVSAGPLSAGAMDPATGYDNHSLGLLSLAYDGLTAFRRVGGVNGMRPVPDLAVAVPAPTDSGRTYVFRVRRGIRYASGAPVRPSDIRRGLERSLRTESSPAPGFFSRIAGAAACPKACDLSRGVVADDRAGTVTIHLTAPDPDLPVKLALPSASAIAPGTAAPGTGPRPPATGPYAIAQVRDQRMVRLTRNPRFRPWSRAARPDGFPDAIDVQQLRSAAGAVGAVRRGIADYAESPVPSAERDSLSTRFPAQVRVSASPSTEYFFLNTRVAPFSSHDARLAVNYALDRRAAVRLMGGPASAQATCQILPPSFPGYRPYCPYSGGAGAAPDLRRARRLVARSHTRGMRVAVWAPAGSQFAAQAGLVARTLHSLGYRSSVRLVEGFKYPRHMADPRTNAQAGLANWLADYPAPSGFVQPLFGCGAAGRDWNWSRFCDPSTDRLTGEALRRQQTDPAGADALWSRVDRRITDAAAALPVLTPRAFHFLSPRAGNYQYSPEWGVLLDQLWVR
jgi:YVTN family beta-propeller protein